MKFLTTEQARAWCQDCGLRVTADHYLSYETGASYCFTLGLGDKPSRLITLADYLIPTWKELSFEGALLWIRARGIWDDFSENTGAMILQQMRLGSGRTEPIEMTPAHLFEPDEIFKMHSYFMIPLLFGWDAFLIPRGRDYFIFVSHDGVAEVVSRSTETLQQVRTRVTKWNPYDDNQWYPRLTGQVHRNE